MKSLFYSPEYVAQAMDESGIQAMIAITAPNIQYLTGYRRGGDSMALLLREDLSHPDLSVNSTNVDYCQEDHCASVGIHTFGFYVRTFADHVVFDEREQFIQRLHRASETKKSRWELVVALLQTARISVGRISVDATADSLVPLVKLLPNLQINSAPNLFRRLCMIKTEEEVERLGEAARITENAILTSDHPAHPAGHFCSGPPDA
jgi:Xaa-Pro aminopeptidase